MKPAVEMTRAELIEEVAYLRSVMYDDPRDDEIRAVCRAFSIYPASGRILILLHRAKGRLVAKWRLLEEMRPELGRERACDDKALQVRVSKIRAAIGKDTVVTVLGADEKWSLGYRLSDIGRAKVAEAFG